MRGWCSGLGLTQAPLPWALPEQGLGAARPAPGAAEGSEPVKAAGAPRRTSDPNTRCESGASVTPRPVPPGRAGPTAPHREGRSRCRVAAASALAGVC